MPCWCFSVPVVHEVPFRHIHIVNIMLFDRLARATRLPMNFTILRDGMVDGILDKMVDRMADLVDLG